MENMIGLSIVTERISFFNPQPNFRTSIMKDALNGTKRLEKTFTHNDTVDV
jgi:hypothetical protein